MAAKNDMENAKCIILEQLKTAIESGVKDNSIWIDKSSNLYLIEEQADAYLGVMENASYTMSFHNPLLDVIKENCANILLDINDNIDFIDLGPGYPDKTFPFLQYCNDNQIACKYIPVDINKKFLDISCEAVTKYNLSLAPLNCTFNEVPKFLNTHNCNSFNNQRIIQIGLTFMNIRPHEILNLLLEIAKEKDVIMVATELINNENYQSIVDSYLNKNVEELNMLLLDILGLSRAFFKYFARFYSGRVELGLESLEDVEVNDEIVLKKGMKIITAISCRYTLENFMTLIKEYDKNAVFFTDKQKKVCLTKIKK